MTCCLKSKYGECHCSDLSCSDGVLVSSCSIETLATNCPTDQPRAVESCSVEEEPGPFGNGAL
jgi:hypothetical protein